MSAAPDTALHNAPDDQLAVPMPHHTRKFILCFDGTGNKFSGTDSDSNILKIYRMLDRSDHTQFHYYQPGIGTYVVSSGGSLSATSTFKKIHSWYTKGKDSMFGTSLAEHVLGGYKFLMRYYRVGDEIFFFGFSRGAYTARFLAEMIDHVGLLSQGNEELITFAWKTFQKWQTRNEATSKDKGEKKKLLDFMMAFRETFSRPVKPIRFLGLFDTVNSVPKFENAIMSRTKFPYTARSSAKVIRHAVSIGERRAKFRQDLIGEKRGKGTRYQSKKDRSKDRPKSYQSDIEKEQDPEKEAEANQERGRSSTLQVPGEHFRDGSDVSGIRARSPNLSVRSDMPANSDVDSQLALAKDDEEEEEEEQDIQEVWFSGCHADIGGGWPLEDGEEVALSHIPLVWMVREAQRAGLRFDEKKMKALHCAPEAHHQDKIIPKKQKTPKIVAPQAPEDEDPFDTTSVDAEGELLADDVKLEDLPLFHRKLHEAACKGKAHDVLCFRNGVAATSVISWNLMEYLPLRRMDLQDDGSWKPICFPLPKGEVRDMPSNVVIHNSVMKRMMADPNFRPGNLIMGGGGRGHRQAPPEFGMGKWKVLREEGDWVGECYVRAEKALESKHNTQSGMKKLLAERKRTMSAEDN